MLKFIKNLFTKKKQFTVDDFNLSERIELKFPELYDKKTKAFYHQIMFFHPLYKEWWILPARSVATCCKWSLLKKGSYGRNGKYIIRIDWYQRVDWRDKFKTMNDLKIYFDHIESRYDELHND